MREPGLAETARAEDRDDAGLADQRSQGTDVLVAADQGRRVEAHALADGVVGGEQLAVHRPERGTGVDAEPVGQVGAVALVAVQGDRGPTHGGLAPQQGRERRVVGERGLEQRQRLVVVPEHRQRPAEHPGRDGQVLRGAGAQAGQRAGVVGRDRPKVECLPSQVAGGDVVATTLRATSGVDKVAEDEGVDGLGGQAEPVAVVGARHHVGAGLGPGAGDDDLQRLARVRRDVVLPDRVDQGVLGDPAALPRHQRGQERVGPAARQRGAAPRHLVEQPEVDAHRR